MNYRKQQQKHINGMARGEDIRESEQDWTVPGRFFGVVLTASPISIKSMYKGFPDGSNCKESACNVGGPGSILGS